MLGRALLFLALLACAFTCNAEEQKLTAAEVDACFWHYYQKTPLPRVDASGDFTVKDIQAAITAGMTPTEYVVGGVIPYFKKDLCLALIAMEADGVEGCISSAFRDDYRQKIASGRKAAIGDSWHGGSRRGGYGQGRAADLVSCDPVREMQLVLNRVVWQWVDTHPEYKVGRPYCDRDPPHAGPMKGPEYSEKHDLYCHTTIIAHGDEQEKLVKLRAMGPHRRGSCAEAEKTSWPPPCLMAKPREAIRGVSCLYMQQFHVFLIIDLYHWKMAQLVLEREYYYPEILVSRIINTIIGIAETLLAIRFILKLLGASPASQFIAWFYDLTSRLVGPFAGAFPSFSLAGFEIETATILAMIAYVIIGWLLIRLFALVFATA
jgi:hypothetical protein